MIFSVLCVLRGESQIIFETDDSCDLSQKMV